MTDDKHNYIDIRKIMDIVLAFSTETDYADLLNIILTKMMEITNSDGGTLYILEDGLLHFRIIKSVSLNIHSQGKDIDIPPIRLDKAYVRNVSAHAAIYNEIVKIDDVYEDERFNFTGPKKFDEDTGYKTTSMLTLPLVSIRGQKPEVLGVIQLINRADNTGKIIPYGNIENPPIIPALANIAAGTLSNHLYTREVRGLLRSLVEVLTKAIDERSLYTKKHTQNVADQCRDFVMFLRGKFEKNHRLYFCDNRLEQLTIAALLHDIGKIITPLEIMDKRDRLGTRLTTIQYRLEIKRHQLEIDMLKGCLTKEEYGREADNLGIVTEFVREINDAPFLPDDKINEVLGLRWIMYKDQGGNTVPIFDEEDIDALTIRKGTLTDGERKTMQEHVTLTGRLLDSIDLWKYYKDVPDWAKNHHEFMDGSGYPNGLTAKDLSAGSLIITIMDIFEALTSALRPYKKGMSKERAFVILGEMADEGKLCKELVGLFKESVGC